MPPRIIDRGRGPEVEGTRITVYDVMDYVVAGDEPEAIAAALRLDPEQVHAALRYIGAHRAEVEVAYRAIMERLRQPNPEWVTAGAARNWEELRDRRRTRAREASGHTPHGRS